VEYLTSHGEVGRLRVFENRVMRKTNGPKREEVIGKWWRLHNQEFHDQVWGTGLMHSGFSWGYLMLGDHFEDAGVVWRIIFMDFQELELGSPRVD
jgi:hypothetical protein